MANTITGFRVVKNGIKSGPLGIGGTGGSGGGGHIIQDAAGNLLEERPYLQFAGYLNTTDNPLASKTIVSDAPISIDWNTWLQLTTEQKQGKKWLITNAPGNLPSDQAIFILQNQTLTFNNLIATVSDNRITENTYPIIYWSDSSYDAAVNAEVSSETSSGVITFTAVSAPSTTLTCDIVFIGNAFSGGESITEGHVIQNASGTSLAQEPSLQFTGDVTVTDDSTNEKTIVNIKTDQSLIATIQTTLVASKSYVVGEQFVYNGLLYKVTTAINSGGAIVIDSNCELADSVTEQIRALNASNIGYDNTTSELSADDMQEAIDELEDAKVSKSGDTITGNLTIDNTNSPTSLFTLGDNRNSHGELWIYSLSGKASKITSNVTSSDKEVSLPNLSGTVALTKMIYPVGTIIISTKSTVPSELAGMWTNIGGGTLATKTVYYYECTAI